MSVLRILHGSTAQSIGPSPEMHVVSKYQRIYTIPCEALLPCPALVVIGGGRVREIVSRDSKIARKRVSEGDITAIAEAPRLHCSRLLPVPSDRLQPTPLPQRAPGSSPARHPPLPCPALPLPPPFFPASPRQLHPPGAERSTN